MRCIETKYEKSYLALGYTINRNMRCIETS